MKPDRPKISFEEYEDREPFVEKWQRRIRENPFLTVGLLGLTGMIGTGTYRYRRLRAQGMSVSIFLINLRVAAQGMVAGALALGLVSHFVKENMLDAEKEKPKQS